MCTRTRGAAKECAAARGSPNRRARGHIRARRRRDICARRRIRSRVISDAEYVRQTLSVDSTHQLHGDVHVSIGSAGHDRRRQIVPLHDSHRVAAPAKPDADVGLFRETNFVGVYSNQQNDVRRSVARSPDRERSGVRSICRRWNVRYCTRGVSEMNARHAIREDSGAAGVRRSVRSRLRADRTRAKSDAEQSVYPPCVRF